MYSHPDLRNSTVVDVPVRRLRPCHSKACYGRERAILSMIRTLRRLGIPVVLLAAEIRASSTFYHRHLAPKVDLLEATRRRVPSRVRRSMTGAHAAAIGLESIDIMCTVTSKPLARSRVAFVPTGTGCTGTRAATQTCSAALVWLTGKALEWLPTLWHTVVTLPKDTIYEIGPRSGKLRSRFTVCECHSSSRRATAFWASGVRSEGGNLLFSVFTVNQAPGRSR